MTSNSSKVEIAIAQAFDVLGRSDTRPLTIEDSKEILALESAIAPYEPMIWGDIISAMRTASSLELLMAF